MKTYYVTVEYNLVIEAESQDDAETAGWDTRLDGLQPSRCNAEAADGSDEEE